MAKPRQHFQCQACGATALKWSGQCPDCEAWNTLVEVTGGDGHQGGYSGRQSARVTPLAEVSTEVASRWPTGLSELDRALGGGLVRGSVVLVGGDPGIGKSTLLLQALGHLAETGPVLYVTGEESPEQVGLRASRLGLGEGVRAQVQLLAETAVERVVAAAEAQAPRVLVVDSIQTLFTEQLQSAPGAVSQVRECAAQLVRLAKAHGIAVFLVGHVTKEGQLAGPRVLEHMVDTVLYFEGESDSRFRVLRSIKNRYGAVNELGVFGMTERGLKPVSNPSAIFLSRRPEPVPGSVVLVTLEGTRPLLVEVQALLDESRLANPRRITLGLDGNRLAMLLAVLHRHGGVFTHDQDVFVNVVGGVRVTETAADAAVALAALSSLRNRPLARELIAFGEVGLSGEMRPVPNGEDRLREAAKHGFRHAVVPAANKPRRSIEGLEVIACQRLEEALAVLDR